MTVVGISGVTYPQQDASWYIGSATKVLLLHLVDVDGQPVHSRGNVWRGMNPLPVTFAVRLSSNRTIGGWLRWEMCFALKRANRHATSLYCRGITTNLEILRSTISAERVAPPRRWNDLCRPGVLPLKDRSWARARKCDDVVYMTSASFSSSDWMQSMVRPASSKRATASRALCRETP